MNRGREMSNGRSPHRPGQTLLDTGKNYFELATFKKKKKFTNNKREGNQPQNHYFSSCEIPHWEKTEKVGSLSLLN